MWKFYRAWRLRIEARSRAWLDHRGRGQRLRAFWKRSKLKSSPWSAERYRQAMHGLMIDRTRLLGARKSKANPAWAHIMYSQGIVCVLFIVVVLVAPSLSCDNLLISSAISPNFCRPRPGQIMSINSTDECSEINNNFGMGRLPFDPRSILTFVPSF